MGSIKCLCHLFISITIQFWPHSLRFFSPLNGFSKCLDDTEETRYLGFQEEREERTRKGAKDRAGRGRQKEGKGRERGEAEGEGRKRRVGKAWKEKGKRCGLIIGPELSGV